MCQSMCATECTSVSQVWVLIRCRTRDLPASELANTNTTRGTCFRDRTAQQATQTLFIPSQEYQYNLPMPGTWILCWSKKAIAHMENTTMPEGVTNPYSPVRVYSHPEVDIEQRSCEVKNISGFFQRSCSIYFRMVVHEAS